jgi:hypothetical protein
VLDAQKILRRAFPLSRTQSPDYTLEAVDKQQWFSTAGAWTAQGLLSGHTFATRRGYSGVFQICKNRQRSLWPEDPWRTCKGWKYAPAQQSLAGFEKLENSFFEEWLEILTEIINFLKNSAYICWMTATISQEPIMMTQSDANVARTRRATRNVTLGHFYSKRGRTKMKFVVQYE